MHVLLCRLHLRCLCVQIRQIAAFQEAVRTATREEEKAGGKWRIKIQNHRSKVTAQKI